MDSVFGSGAWLGVFLVSCLIAHAAGGGARTWAWGALGPIGWIVAAIIGVQHRADQRAARETAPSAPRVAATVPIYDLVDRCPSCGNDVAFKSSDVGKPVWCGACDYTSAHAGGRRID